MFIMDILIRSISGYVFVVPGVLLYFGYLKKHSRKQTAYHIVTAFIFCYYLIGILTMTGIGKLKPFAPKIVIIPFADMINGPIDTILNIILFFPLGFFIPLLYKTYNRISRVALISFSLSLSIEFIQMFGRGITDINDLITNTMGACLGYLIYGLFRKVIPDRLYEKFQTKQMNDSIEILFFAVYSFVIMITIQPILISKFFHLG